MQLNKQLLCAAALSLVTIPGSSQPAPECSPDLLLTGRWQAEGQVAGTTIYLPVGGSTRLPAAAAAIHWPFAPGRLFNAVHDYDKFSTLIPNVDSSRVVSTSGQRDWVYQSLHFPGLARDRHYLLESTWQLQRTPRLHYRIRWHLSDRFPLPVRNERVEPEQFNGCWDIRESATGGSDAVYQVELAPGGWLPHWLVQQTMRHYLQSVLTAIRRHLQQAPWQASPGIQPERR